MALEIRYCVNCNFLPRASSLAAAIRRDRNLEVTLVPGKDGEFEVTLDGALIFSKRAEGRFPEPAEVITKIPSPAG